MISCPCPNRGSSALTTRGRRPLLQHWQMGCTQDRLQSAPSRKLPWSGRAAPAPPRGRPWPRRRGHGRRARWRTRLPRPRSLPGPGHHPAAARRRQTARIAPGKWARALTTAMRGSGRPWGAPRRGAGGARGPGPRGSPAVQCLLEPKRTCPQMPRATLRMPPCRPTVRQRARSPLRAAPRLEWVWRMACKEQRSLSRPRTSRHSASRERAGAAPALASRAPSRSPAGPSTSRRPSPRRSRTTPRARPRA
mmetsp:Transcript_69692/g.168593  ORF Transcript_69692/g.168593 Transcript_69692/m.168593 type:complete len:250 (-) Transcript_69692:116-865(-)